MTADEPSHEGAAQEPRPTASAYAAAGVDLDAADAAVRRMAPHLARTATEAVLPDRAGGYGGLYALPGGAGGSRPVLVSSTDGVGTKLELARALGSLRTVGVDLVAMVVDDLVCTGARPLFLQDYLAVGAVDPDEVEDLVAGVADGCEQAGCALLGGELAEHPGVMAPGQVDLAGFGVGIVEEGAILGPHRVQEGDAIVALASSGPHSNGYSLIRRVVEGADLHAEHPALGESLGAALLRPTRVYAQDCLALLAATPVHALAHVTGGGIPGNLPRVLPAGLGAVVRTETFPVPPVLGVLRDLGDLDPEELWQVFNMGAGMLAVVPDPDQALAVLGERGVPAWHCGEVTVGEGVALTGRDSSSP